MPGDRWGYLYAQYAVTMGWRYRHKTVSLHFIQRLWYSSQS